MDPRYRIRIARRDELQALTEIERLAARRFEEYGLADLFSRIVTPPDILREREQAGCVWAAADGEDRPVGFVIATTIDGAAHIDELDVHTEHGRRGIGAALVETVCDWARSTGFRAVTLSTLRSIPWNAPFYAKLGFRVLEENELTELLRELLEYEASIGLPMDDRVLMRREL